MKDPYHKTIKAQLKEFEAQIEGLLAKAGKATAEIKTECNEQLEVLRSKRAIARGKLRELEGPSEEAWQDLKLGVEDALDELKKAVPSAVSSFE